MKTKINLYYECKSKKKFFLFFFLISSASVVIELYHCNLLATLFIYIIWVMNLFFPIFYKKELFVLNYYSGANQRLSD